MCPLSVCETMVHAAREMDKLGWIVRSGHAQGADQAWELGHHLARREIYLPWNGFNDGYGPGVFVSPPSPALAAVAALVHPRWDYLKDGAKKLMMRNVSIILGHNLNDPVKFVAYWSPDRKVQGGTGNAIKLAQSYNIPTFNIGFEDEQEAMTEFINTFA